MSRGVKLAARQKEAARFIVMRRSRKKTIKIEKDDKRKKDDKKKKTIKRKRTIKEVRPTLPF
jgi:hypothetical protein